MTEATIAVKALKSKYWNEEKKKFITSKQFKDENGLSVGPVQYFEADTLEELLEKKDAAHENASVALYKTRQQVALGTMLEPDPDDPILTYEPRQLSADERVRISKDLSDPAKAAEAHRQLLEAEFGAPIEKVRENFRQQEIDRRVSSIQTAIAQFKSETPEYIECAQNSDNMKKYMTKHNRRYTANNLKIAFEYLKTNSLLVLQAPKAAVTEVTPVVTAPAVTPEIPVSSNTPPAIPAQVTEVRPKQSSSGLGRADTSAPPSGTPPKTVGITIREINSMSSVAYSKALLSGIPERGITAQDFKNAIDELYKKK